MALQTELLSILDNSEEPLPKRLRIATDIFNSNELPAFKKESILFSWIGKTCLKTDVIDVWDTLNECIISPQMKGISANEINHTVINTIVKALIKQLKKECSENFKKHVEKCGFAILNNDTFQQYFKHDLKHYCELVAKLLLSTENVDVIEGIITTNLSFLNENIDMLNYTSNFLDITLDALIKVVAKFKDDNLFNEAQKLIKRAIFSTNSNDFIKFLSSLHEESTPQFSNLILEKLQIFYNYDTEIAKCAFKIIFSTCLSICNTEVLKYKLIVLIIHLLGFKVKRMFELNLPKIDTNFSLQRSLDILSEIFAVIHAKNIIINENINEIKFSDFLKYLIISVIRLQTQPNISTLIILTYIIEIDPLIIETSIDEIIALIALFEKNEKLLMVYSEFMISIMKMYTKLHRVGKFYSVLLETIQKKICLNFKYSKPEIKFVGENISSSSLEITTYIKNVLPANVLNYFQECITLQHSTEVTKIVRTCIYNLKQISDNFQYYNDEERVFFVLIISEITCNVLSGIKLADNSTTEHSLDRFVNDLNCLRDELKKFGTVLLTVEHNHLLMSSFLNICYTWAEVALLLAYYTKAENLNFRGELENNTSINDLTYLHNYLSAAQWSLVLQRIKNFGEQPCKYVLQKLHIQKLRAVMIFETTINETLESSTISNYATNLETSWDLILSERIIASSFVCKMETTQLINLSQLLFNYVFENNDFELLKHRTIIDSRDLMTSMFYISLSKISNLFRRKRKHGDSVKIKPICTQIFKDIDENSFIRNETVDMEKLIQNLTNAPNEIKSLEINEENFCNFMEIIKHIPVIFLSYDLQVTFFFFLLSICYDLRNCKNKNINILKKCEEYLSALVENPLSSPNILNYLQSDILIKYILESVEQYKLLLSIIIGKGLTQNDTIPLFSQALHLLQKNSSDDKSLEIIFVILHLINNSALKNITEDNKIVLKEYQGKLYSELQKNILVDENISDNKVIAYTLLLQNCLNNNVDTSAKLIPLVKQYADYAVNNINNNNAEEFLLFFKLLLSKKSDFKDISEDFNMVSWRACKDLINIEKIKHFNTIITLIFRDSSSSDFSDILQQLLQKSLSFIKSNQTSNIINQFRIWSKLVHSNLSKDKNDRVSNMTQILLSNLALFLTTNNASQEFVEDFINFQTDLIKNLEFILSPTIIDVHFQTTHVLISKENTFQELITAFETGFTILESLARFRKELLIDRLPTFLLHFRLYLHHLCVKSNSNINLEETDLTKIIECAFRVEKLVRNICTMKKDITRIAPYLIADFLKEYETIPLHSHIKFHLNNCLMELVGLCDSHAIQFLLRVLSPASTELFKELHDNYNKYYKFTGKV